MSQTMESNGRDISREIKDQVQLLIGNRSRIVELRQFDLLNRNKYEARLLALTNYRVHILSARPPLKLDQAFNFLEIRAIESPTPTEVTFSVEPSSRTLKLRCVSEDRSVDLDDVITFICQTLASTFHSIPLDTFIRRLDLQPPARHTELIYDLDLVRSDQATGNVPCGNYSAAYACMCDLHNLPYMDEVAWDIDTIYQCQDTKEFALADFDHLDVRHLVPVLAALRYNLWFTHLTVSSMKLANDTIAEVIEVFKTNVTLKQLSIPAAGLRADFVQRLVAAISVNRACSLCALDLSGNLIEDKGVNNLCAASSLVSSLTQLNLAATKLSSAGLKQLMITFTNTKQLMSQSLTQINLADNQLRGSDDSMSFLSMRNNITHLNLAGTDSSLEQIFGILVSGCLLTIQHLDLSRNVYSSKKLSSKDVVPQSWQQFFASATSLVSVNLASCKLPAEAVRQVLIGLEHNIHVTNLDLNLCTNGLGAAGAQVLESKLPSITCLYHLDVSDNGFEQSLSIVAKTVAKTKGLRKLSVGKNFNTIRPKLIPRILDEFVYMLQAESCSLESLRLDEMKLKGDTAIIINGLSSTSKLSELDISGNMMGDESIRMLAKVLQINDKLTTIYWDGNNTSAAGFQYIASALARNYSVKQMPIPVIDAAFALKANQEKTSHALKSIEMTLQRNHKVQRCHVEQSYRLTQNSLISPAQQVVDRFAGYVEKVVAKLEQQPGLTSGELTEIKQAKQLVDEAKSSSQLFRDLTAVAGSFESNTGAICGMLKTFEHNLQVLLENQLKMAFNQMTKSAEAAVPSGSNSSASNSRESNAMSKDFVHTVVMEHASVEILNHVSEINLTTAANLFTHHVQALTAKLESTLKSLMAASPPPTSTVKLRTPSTTSAQQKPGMFSVRESMHGRLMRPEMRFDEKEIGDLNDKNTSRRNASDGSALPGTGSESAETKEIVHRYEPSRGKMLCSLADLDLPSSAGASKLEHLLKDRPRRFKTTPSHTPISLQTSLLDDRDEIERSVASVSQDGGAVSKSRDVIFKTPSQTPPTSTTQVFTADQSGEGSLYDKKNQATKVPVMSPRLTAATDSGVISTHEATLASPPPVILVSDVGPFEKVSQPSTDVQHFGQSLEQTSSGMVFHNSSENVANIVERSNSTIGDSAHKLKVAPPTKKKSTEFVSTDNDGVAGGRPGALQLPDMHAIKAHLKPLDLKSAQRSPHPSVVASTGSRSPLISSRALPAASSSPTTAVPSTTPSSTAENSQVVPPSVVTKRLASPKTSVEGSAGGGSAVNRLSVGPAEMRAPNTATDNSGKDKRLSIAELSANFNNSSAKAAPAVPVKRNGSSDTPKL